MATFPKMFPALDDNSGIIVFGNELKTNLVRLLKSERIPGPKQAVDSVCLQDERRSGIVGIDLGYS